MWSPNFFRYQVDKTFGVYISAAIPYKEIKKICVDDSSFVVPYANVKGQRVTFFLLCMLYKERCEQLEGGAMAKPLW